MAVKDFKTSGYFSGMILFGGALCIFFAIMFVSTNWIASAILVAISVVIFTTHYRFRIDFENKTYHDYLWILGMKQGEKGKFLQVEYLFVKTSKVSQSMHLRVSSSTITKYVFDAYIKISPEKKIHLFTKESKHDVLVRLKELASILSTKVVDYTLEEPTEIKSE
jgi:hypothetical protein